MARRVFFSFHYDEDIVRAQQVRNSWVTQQWTAEEKIYRGFFDAGLWESAKTTGRAAVEGLIDEGLVNTSVTAVLIGSETYSRPYVMYEIEESHGRDNGLLGVYIGGLKDFGGRVGSNGPNPFNYSDTPSDFPVYNWVTDEGYKNFGLWVEQAYQRSGRA